LSWWKERKTQKLDKKRHLCNTTAARALLRIFLWLIPILEYCVLYNFRIMHVSNNSMHVYCSWTSVLYMSGV